MKRVHYQGLKLHVLSFLIFGTSKNGDGNANLGAEFPTGNQGIVRLMYILKLGFSDRKPRNPNSDAGFPTGNPSYNLIISSPALYYCSSRTLSFCPHVLPND